MLWCSLPPDPAAAAGLVAAIAAVIATAFLVQALAPAVLGVAQGDSWRYWRLAWLPLKIQKCYQDKGNHAYRYPLKSKHLQPTRIGNSLAALTERVEQHLGYELAVIWNVLIASLPGDATEALAAQSRAIYLAVQNLILSAAAVVATIIVIPGGWPLVVAPIFFFLLTIGLWRSLGAAFDDYSDLVLTMLILHRDAFYQALAETPPQPGDDIAQRGAALSDKIKEIVE